MNQQIVCGDARKELTRVPSASIAAVITSPPYNIGKAYEGVLSLPEYVTFIGSVVAECDRVLRPGGAMCFQLGHNVRNGSVLPLDIALYPIFAELGLILRNRIVWTFGHGLHCSNRFSGRHETVLWFTKGAEYHFDLDSVRVPQLYPGKKHFKGPRKGQLSGNPLGKNPGDVWDIPNVKHNHPEKTAHPCQFPEQLVERLMRATTRPGEVVLDPFAGSGTVGAVAARLRRDALLIEIDATYVEIARARIEREVRKHNSESVTA